jgi:hypothetical protein
MAEPGAPVSLVAVRDRREQAIQRLSDTFVADLLTMEEFEERLGRVHAATSIAELDVIVADLEPLPSGVVSTALAPLAVSRELAPAIKRIRSVFGNVERRGGWVVPAQIQVAATFGNLELDFREARFTAEVTEIDARVVFGNLEIIVPPQLAVDCEGSSVLGNIESHGTGAVADPGRPLLRIRGYAVLGNVEVHTRLPGESESDARRRRKRDGLAGKSSPRLETDRQR